MLTCASIGPGPKVISPQGGDPERGKLRSRCDGCRTVEIIFFHLCPLQELRAGRTDGPRNVSKSRSICQDRGELRWRMVVCAVYDAADLMELGRVMSLWPYLQDI